MANLLSNTTIGGYQSIHTGNIGSYALTSLPSHNHDDRYFTESESDGRFQPLENQRLSTSSTVRFSNTYTTAWFRNDNSNTGLYNESTTMHWSSNENGFWDVSSTNTESSIRFYTGGHKSALRGYVYANSSSYIGFLSAGGNWSLRTDSARNTTLFGNLTVGQDVGYSSIFMYDSDEGVREIHCNSNRIGFLTQSGSWGAYADDSANWFSTGYIQSFTSMYSPVYYDGNNSAYYVDPDGISNIWRLYANGKYHYFGSSDNWDNGNLNGENSIITNVHFQGHPDFWIGAGNTKWYTSVASGHHDLLINTMQASGGNIRGITFTASTSGGSVYRLGRWFSHNTQVGSYLQVDGGIKVGGTTDNYNAPVAKLQVISSTSGSDVLAVDGVNGRLFTVTDDLSDSLFSVNTIAGLPVIEAFADNTVKIGKYGSNSITISNSKIAINSDSVDSNFPFYVGDRSTAGSRYSLTNPGMGFNLADSYAQLQLFGTSGAYIDFTTSSGQDSAGRIMWNGQFIFSGDVYFNNPLYTYTLYDRNDTGYYLDMNGTSRLGTVIANELRSYGTTYLGDSNGDEVHINDILRVGATDSGDAHFYFGEGSLAGSDYGMHWYWDSGYTFTWYTRNAGSDTALFDYVTNDTTYINWRRNFHMQNRSIDYTSQLHFNGGTRFQANDDHYLLFRADAANYGGMMVRDGNNSTRGYLGYFDSNGFGLLTSGGSWGIRLNPGNAETLLFYNGDWKVRTGSNGIGVNGNVYTDQNYGHGLVGLYSAERYQGVFAMGDSYKLSADGTSPGSLYGIAWTHTNVGGESKSGLGHQALFMTNGVTQTAIGTGIWTNGLITTTSYGTSANWNTAYSWGNHASAGYVTSSALSSYLPLSGGTMSGHLNVSYNIASPSNYYSGLQAEIMATSGTAGIALHRSGYSHVGIYHDSINELKFNFNGGTPILPATAGTLWGSGNLTNLNQLTNGPGYLRLNTWEGNSYIATGGAHYGTIFYDSNDNNYYVDPNSNSNLYSLYTYAYRGNGNVGGTGNASWHPDGIYCGSTMWQYGTMYKNNTGIYDVSEFKLNAGPVLGTYNTRNLIVKAHDSNDVMGILGQKSGGGFAFQIYGDGTNYGFLDGSWAGWDIKKTVDGAMYMNDDNSYYLYTNSESRFNTFTTAGSVVIGGTFGNNPYNAVGSTRLLFGGGNEPNNYFIGTNMENYGGNYTKLDLRWHTGIRMGAQPGYGGIRFFNNETLGSRIMSIGEGDANIRIDNNLWIGGAGGWITDLLNAKQNASTAITTSNIGTQSVSYASSAGSVAWTNVSSRPTALSQFTNDLGNYGGWITSSGSISGNAATATNVAWSGVTSKPAGWLNEPNLIQDMEPSATAFPSGFYQSYVGAGNPTGTWFNYINVRHSNTNNGHGFQLGMSYYDTNLWFRSYQGGTSPSFSAWNYAIHSGNIGSQSVNYANSAGSASSATTATTATVASQLNKFGDIYGQDWNSYYIQDKLIAAAVYGHSGANRPVTTYDYGVALSYGEATGPVMQMYFPENSPNLGTIFRKAHYRTGWNGNWSTWKTIVEQEGNTCTIVGGNQTGMEIHANVGYNQDPLTYFLLRGQADTSWKALKIRLTGDAGGQDIEFRRIAENGADARMFYVPRGANQVIFEYQFVQGSDSRLKDNIIPITNSLDKVKSLRGVEFDWNSGVNEGTHDVGLIAQDVEAVLPEAVTTQEDGYKNLAYTKVIPLLVEAMKEQQATIENLLNRIKALEDK